MIERNSASTKKLVNESDSARKGENTTENKLELRSWQSLTKHEIDDIVYTVLQAVIASRTNYLLALGELRRYRPEMFEIPVYLADSILVESI
jgi:hypothetical protein